MSFNQFSLEINNEELFFFLKPFNQSKMSFIRLDMPIIEEQKGWWCGKYTQPNLAHKEFNAIDLFLIIRRHGAYIYLIFILFKNIFFGI